MLIPLKQWAEKVGIAPVTARQKAVRGTIPARKIGRDWLIEESTPNTDSRLKSGNFKNWRNKSMKALKENVLNELENLTADYHAVQLRRAALNVGCNHLSTQACHEILNSFMKSNPNFKIYQLADNPKDSFFCSAFVSDNETSPIDEATRA